MALGLIGAAAVAVVAFLVAPQGSDGDGPPAFQGHIQQFTQVRPVVPAPPVQMLTADGRTVSLADLRGKVVLLNFWATWCAPCIAELPALLDLQKSMGGEDFTVVALSQDARGWEQVTPFVERLEIGALPVFVDPGGKAGAAMKVEGLPTTVLIDAEGRVRGYLKGQAEWNSAAAKALIRHYMAGGPAA